MTDVLPMTIYCAVMSITPGPNNTMLIASGANFGYRGTLPQILGITFGGLAMTVASCLGLGALFMAFPAAQVTLRIAGALYLGWLAWKVSGMQVGAATAPRPVSFTQGALLQVINPKAWIKAVTLGSIFMPQGLAGVDATLIVSAVGLLVGFPCLSAWALFGVAVRGFLREPARQRVFNLGMAAALLVLALLIMR
jgi:threonine/homoserine/homoserine lactone efflux protein